MSERALTSRLVGWINHAIASWTFLLITTIFFELGHRFMTGRGLDLSISLLTYYVDIIVLMALREQAKAQRLSEEREREREVRDDQRFMQTLQGMEQQLMSQAKTDKVLVDMLCDLVAQRCPPPG